MLWGINSTGNSQKQSSNMATPLAAVVDSMTSKFPTPLIIINNKLNHAKSLPEVSTVMFNSKNMK